MASGGEALGTSYAVGEQFDKALEDYFKIKATLPPEVKIKVASESEEEEEEEFIEQHFFDAPVEKDSTAVRGTTLLTTEQLRGALFKHLGGLFADRYLIYRYLERKEYDKALKIAQVFIKKFLLNLNKKLFPIDDHLITDQDLDKLIQVLGTHEGFPFNPEELKFYLARTMGLSLNEEDNKEAMLKDLYELLSTFYQQIKFTVEKK